MVECLSHSTCETPRWLSRTQYGNCEIQLGHGPGLTSVITNPVSIKASSLATDTCQDRATLQRQKWYVILNTEKNCPSMLPQVQNDTVQYFFAWNSIKRVSSFKSSLTYGSGLLFHVQDVEETVFQKLYVCLAKILTVMGKWMEFREHWPQKIC